MGTSASMSAMFLGSGRKIKMWNGWLDSEWLGTHMHEWIIQWLGARAWVWEGGRGGGGRENMSLDL
jgi:hypothetical protein